jgi:hypothetical protein
MAGNEDAADAAGKREFAELVRDAIVRAGETAALRYDADEFRLLAGDDNKNILNLGNAYAEYRAAAADVRGRVVRRFARCWFATRRGVPDQYEDVTPDLLPGVRNRAYFEMIRLRLQAEGQKPPEWPYRVLAGRLGVGVVYDLRESMLQVQQHHLTSWGVGFDEALRAAVDNLGEISRDEWYDLAPGVWASPWHDNYDASRLLLTGLVRGLDVAGDPVAMAPNRDALLVAGADDADGLARLAALAEAAQQHPRPVSGAALRLDGETWLPFLPDPAHPEYPRFKRLWLQTLAGDYGEQKELLNAWHTREGRDVWVASFSGRPDAATGALVSYAVWSEGVETLLPRTDEVVFFRAKGTGDGEVLARADWGRVERVAGRLLTAQGLYPERYRVNEFPTAEELAALGVGKV